MKRANRTMTSRTRSGSGPVLPSHQEAMPRVGAPTGVRAVPGGRGLLPPIGARASPAASDRPEREARGLPGQEARPHSRAHNGRIVARPRAPPSPPGSPLASADVTPGRLRRQLPGEAGHLLGASSRPRPRFRRADNRALSLPN